MRGYLDHIDDLKADHVISSTDIICLTETYLCNSDTIHPNSQPIKSHVQYRADRVGGVQKGGILIFVNRQIPSTHLNRQIPGLEFLTTSLSPNPNTKIVLIRLHCTDDQVQYLLKSSWQWSNNCSLVLHYYIQRY